ncbi:MAG TPA: hypothetical protein DCR43_02855 [Bacteroidales bacterium]|nr:MAG: hypothetical protein A2X09_13590 [Bacteroidetes bacterium GWF2_43_11]HAQ64783.1 hypothetical protein [Bacteroidales bacterium]HBZ67850.1 hypothetical protein [Bacteroidales bacterium]
MNPFKIMFKLSKGGVSFKGKYLKFRRSIYGRVVLIITILSVFLFVSFGLIFRSVYEQYLNTVILQNGNNVGSLVEGALYRSMVENDQSSLQSTLDIIHNMPGIEEVNMYDDENNLVYTSLPMDTLREFQPDCKSCHNDLNTIFPRKEKTYRIISAENKCKMYEHNQDERHLLIISPILNSKSCYENSCHAHGATDDVLGSLVINVPLEELDSTVNKSSLEFYMLATLTTILLASFLIFFTRREIKKPLNKLILASVAVAKGERNTRIEVKSNQLDDMNMVSIAFNQMLDHLQKATIELENWSQQLEYKVQKKTEELSTAQNELIHIDRLASLGKLSSSVAHEINNPLSGILIYTKLVNKLFANKELSDEKRGVVMKHLKMIETETKRCGEIVKGLLDFSKKDQEGYEPKSLHEILQETYDLMAHQLKIANIRFLMEFTAKADVIYCSPNQIKQACMAMLVNSKEAITENGEIIIRTMNPDADTIQLDIADNGIGISHDDLAHIFEPFFSSKQEASGIGLGLAIVHGIIQSHKGRIHVSSESGHGATFSIVLSLVKN